MTIQKVCIYCASSTKCDPIYHKAAYRLGQILAEGSITIVYGGGAAGSMGSLADGALSKNGNVIGIIPEFMYQLGWGQKKITEMVIVENMHLRKQKMIESTDAVVALPGGCGTFEELFEALTLKRLGVYKNPIVILNTNGFYNPFIEWMRRAIDEKFMDERHSMMWTIADQPEEILPAIQSAPEWFDDAVSFASM